MHAVATRVTIKDVEAGAQHVRENVVPRVSQAPGFVAGYWFRLPDGGQGRALMVFESEEQARQAAEQLQPPPENVAQLDSVDVVEIIASA